MYHSGGLNCNRIDEEELQKSCKVSLIKIYDIFRECNTETFILVETVLFFVLENICSLLEPTYQLP